MKRIIILLLFITHFTYSQEITLKHNIGNNIVDQYGNFSCTGGNVNWARTFVLEDFGVTGEYSINSGSFGIQEANTAPGDGVIVNIYEIDEGFPDTFDNTLLLGSGPLVDIPPTGHQIFTFDFNPPIVITQDIDRILVEVHLGNQTQNVFIGGTSDSYDFSWFQAGCMGNPDDYQNNYDINLPDLNYYITVTGEHYLNINDNDKDIISLTPNPVRNILVLHLPSEIVYSEIKIFDINGKITPLKYRNDLIDVSNLSDGLYFLKIMTPEGILSKKFIKH